MHYYLLSFSTCIILFLSLKIWRKTKEVSFLLGIGLIYYWSLLGAWFVVYDNITGNKGKDFGLHYYYLFEKLFPVEADHIYLYSLALYSLFIIVVQIVILCFTKKRPDFIQQEFRPLKINHFLLIAMCIGAVIVSLTMVWRNVLIAAISEQSVHLITQQNPDKYFTLHQLLNHTSAVALYIGFISCICGDNARYINGERKRFTMLLYVIAIFFVSGYLLFLGNKKEILFGGIIGILFYIQNIKYRINYKWVILIITIIIFPLFFNDALRSISPTFLLEYFQLEGDYYLETEIVSSGFTVKNAASTFLFSNEMFCAHFSMYGILYYDIPLTYGSSFVSLFASIVPRILWTDRPEGIYQYYTYYLDVYHKQGFTIHHASGWYLNFGVPGLIAGAFMLGLIWSFFYNHLHIIQTNKKLFLKIIFIIGLATFTAQIPALIRCGPEGYKALVFEALLLPAIVLYIAAKFHKSRK